MAVAEKREPVLKPKSRKEGAGPSVADTPDGIKVVCTAERFIKLKDMKPWADNPRKITRDGYKRLRQSMITVGIFKPFVMWKRNGGILGGNQKYWILLDLEKEGWKIPPLPASFVDVSPEVAKAVVIRDNIQDGDWEQDGFSRYIAELSKTYGDSTAQVLGIPQAQINDLLLHYTKITEDATTEGDEIQRSAEQRLEQLTRHFIGMGMPPEEAQRRAEIFQYSGAAVSVKGESRSLPMGKNLGRRIEVTFWFDTVEQVEVVTEAFSQPKTVDLDSLKLYQVSRRLLEQGGESDS